MNIKDVIRAWKESDYWDNLGEEQRALLPENPIGDDLSEEVLRSISGGEGVLLRSAGDSVVCICSAVSCKPSC